MDYKYENDGHIHVGLSTCIYNNQYHFLYHFHDYIFFFLVVLEVFTSATLRISDVCMYVTRRKKGRKQSCLHIIDLYCPFWGKIRQTSGVGGSDA